MSKSYTAITHDFKKNCTGFTVYQHWRSAVTCAAALELPSDLTLELKPKDK